MSRINLDTVCIPLRPHKIHANNVLSGGQAGRSIVLTYGLRRQCPFHFQFHDPTSPSSFLLFISETISVTDIRTQFLVGRACPAGHILMWRFVSLLYLLRDLGGSENIAFA